MSLAAKTKENKIYYSTNISNDFGKNNSFQCIGCNEELIFHRNVCGKRIAHFAHKTKCYFETEPETKEHMSIKKWMYDNISNFYKKNIPDSFFIEDQKPDLLIEINDLKIAIEVQCSKISYESFMERTKKYSDKGIYVFWLFGENWQDEGKEKQVSIIEKELHFLNYGRIYWFKDDSILPIHFDKVVRISNLCGDCWWEENCGYKPCEEGDDERCWVSRNGLEGEFEKTLKSTKKIKKYISYKSNIEFDLFINKGFRLAKLKDPIWWKNDI